MLCSILSWGLHSPTKLIPPFHSVRITLFPFGLLSCLLLTTPYCPLAGHRRNECTVLLVDFACASLCFSRSSPWALTRQISPSFMLFVLKRDISDFRDTRSLEHDANTMTSSPWLATPTACSLRDLLDLALHRKYGPVFTTPHTAARCPMLNLVLVDDHLPDGPNSAALGT